MRKTLPKILEDARAVFGDFASERGDSFGAFKLRCPLTSTWLNIIAGSEEAWQACDLPGPPWEHVSVSTVQRVPSWEEMCWVKELFWDDSECVVQYHPPKNVYVNEHPNVLHLWRPVGVDFPMPPLECV